MPSRSVQPLDLPALAQLTGLLLWHYTTSAPAMELEQMRAIAGVEMLESRANQVIETYGQASAILPADTPANMKEQNKTALPTGNWVLVYTLRKPPGSHNNKEKTLGLLRLADYSRLELYARGGVGRVIVRRKPQKTSYEIPRDPYQSHQIISVSGKLRQPMSPDTLVKNFGNKYEEIQDADKRHWIRYWIMQREGAMPLRMYAVDFGFDAQRKKITELVANGPQVEFVTEALVSRYKIWEQNMYD